MRQHIALLIALLTCTFASSAYAQAPPTTVERTAEGGWAGPCDPFWDTTEFAYNATRVCRVTTYLARSWKPEMDGAKAAGIANNLFRICWGTFPKSGGDCTGVNAWAYPRSWIEAAVRAQRGGFAPAALPPPAVITIRASELVQSDDELAFLMAHEMGHAVDQQQTSGQSAFNEQRADMAAIGFLVKAGYDARSAGRSLQNLSMERGQGMFGNLLGIIGGTLTQAGDVHGLTADRIRLMKEVFARGCAGLGNKPLGCKEGWK
jgi:hypothetical protein